jgi:trehalose-phosphatase
MKRQLPPIWKEWKRLEMALKKNELILLCDYDGTLAPISANPKLAVLPGGTRAALKTLSRKKHVITGIVSGRPLGEVRTMVGLKNILYIGSHGHEMALPGGRGKPRLSQTQLARLRDLGRELERALTGLRGIWVEHKAAGMAVHYRTASPIAARLAIKRLQCLAEKRKKNFRIQEGKRVFEFVPLGKINKGSAVREAVRRLKPRGPSVKVYLGDDLTDESVFSSLGQRDFGVFVGKPQASSARYSLRSPGEVRHFLIALGAIAR